MGGECTTDGALVLENFFSWGQARLEFPQFAATKLKRGTGNVIGNPHVLGQAIIQQTLVFGSLYVGEHARERFLAAKYLAHIRCPYESLFAHRLLERARNGMFHVYHGHVAEGVRRILRVGGICAPRED